MGFLLCFSLFLILLCFASTTASQHLHLPLSHSLSKTHFTTTHHLLKSTTAASAARHRRHSAKTHHPKHQQVSLPLSPGSDYTLTFSLNSQTLSVYMDTGSDVVWFPCSPFECILCEGKFEPGTLSPLNVSRSSHLPCSSAACSAAHNSLPSNDLCNMAKCPLIDIEMDDCSNYTCPPFYYAYGDGSLIANLHRANIIMPSNSKKSR